MFNLTYEFKLKPTQKQIAIFEEWLETHRRVYNHALAERKDWYRSRSCQVNACSIHSCYIIPPDAPRPTFAQCKSLTVCSNCGYTTDRDVAAAQVVAIRGAAVGHTVKMLAVSGAAR